MTQSTKVASISIDASITGSRSISSDVDGTMKFIDSEITSGVSLGNLAGLNSIDNLYPVGAGYGCKYSTIQEAIDEVPVNSGIYVPATILVMPGLYEEDLTIETDGITIKGIGGVVIRSLTNVSTLTIKSSVTSTPKNIGIYGVRIENTRNGKSCIDITGGSASEVGLGGIMISECELYASGVGTHHLYAVSSNNIILKNNHLSGSSSSLVRVEQCHSFLMDSVTGINHLQFGYDSTDPSPMTTGSSYIVYNSEICGNLVSTISGSGSLLISGSACPSSVYGNMTFNGDMGVFINGCKMGGVTNNGSDLIVSGSYLGSVSGTGTYSDDKITGTVTFDTSASESVVFGVSLPDDEYSVFTECGIDAQVLISAKLDTGFTMGFSAPKTTTVDYVVVRK